MKYFQAISIISALAGLTSAAPAAESRQFKAVITFSGAAASYTMDVPTDATLFYTSKYICIYMEKRGELKPWLQLTSPIPTLKLRKQWDVF